MKALTGILICVTVLGFSLQTAAQQEKDSTSLRKKAERVADTVGNKVEKAVKTGKAKIVDKVYVDKVGPDGQTIYIDKHDKYYYIDSKGKKMYVTKEQLKNKID